MTDAPIRHARKHPRRLRAPQIVLICIAAVLALSIGGIGTYAYVVSQSFNSSPKITNPFPAETLRPPVPTGKAAAAQNILLMGSDTRGTIGKSLSRIIGSRSDTMMTVHISADRTHLTVMSIMRDSWVAIPGYGSAKINAALAYGGVPLVIRTVESIIGSRIDHVAIVDFAGFRDITTALGGVTVDVPKSFRAAPYAFHAGPMTLQGDQALAFVRERHAFADGDYQRVRDQQAFIKALIQRTMSKQTLTNPATIAKLVGAVAPYLAVDSGLDSSYAVGLGLELRSLQPSDVRFFTMPTLGTGNIGGQSIVRVDTVELAKVKAAFQADTVYQYIPPASSTR